MKEIKIKLASLPFSECTYGCLVNLNYVRRVGKDSVVLTPDKELPLSRRIKKQFAQCINFPLQRNITFKSHGNP